jgi:hypothetical protein
LVAAGFSQRLHRRDACATKKMRTPPSFQVNILPIKPSLDPDHRELLAMAEVIAQPSLGQWYGCFKGVRFRPRFL